MKHTAICMILTLITMSSSGFYHDCFTPSEEGNTIVKWNVIDSPLTPVAWGWSGSEKWLVQRDSRITFEVIAVEPEIAGILTIGNLTINANNSQIGTELVLGVWGLTPFFPGLIIPIDDEAVDRLNQTAQDSASRKSGNYMNGSMAVYTEQVVSSNETYHCVVFDYVQDPVGFGEAQKTELKYDLETGVLVFCNTSYSFGTPYILSLEISSIEHPAGLSSPDSLLLMMIALSGTATVIVFTFGVCYFKRR